MDIIIEEQNANFHYRVRGIIKKDNKILLMHSEDDEYFFLPGGHIEIGETSEQAIKREIREEIGIEVNIKKLVCIHEHFYKKKNANFHEVVFYFIVIPKDHIQVKNTIRFENTNGKIVSINLKWATATEIIEMNVKPQMLKNLIAKDELMTFSHVVN